MSTHMAGSIDLFTFWSSAFSYCGGCEGGPYKPTSIWNRNLTANTVWATDRSNVASPRTKGQIPQCRKEVFHLLLQKPVAVLCILSCAFRVSQFDLQHALFLFFLLHLLFQALHLHTQGSTGLLQSIGTLKWETLFILSSLVSNLSESCDNIFFGFKTRRLTYFWILAS